MTGNKLNKEAKQAELIKYRDLVLATLDYHINNNVLQIKTVDFDSTEHFKGLKIQAGELYKKGRLTRLKQWFCDLTEMQVEIGDLKFSKYLQEKTKYNIDIFKSYFERIEKVIEKGKITTDNQYYQINTMAGQFCQYEPVDNNKIEILNRLLREYKQRKLQQRRQPTK